MESKSIIARSFFGAVEQWSVKQQIPMTIVVEKMIKGLLHMRPQLMGKTKEELVRLLKEEYYIMTSKTLLPAEKVKLRNKLYGEKE